MSTRFYRLTLLCAACVAIWSALAALWLLLAGGDWADACGALALATAGMIVAASALHHILYPHDHPSPRYRLPRTRLRN